MPFSLLAPNPTVQIQLGEKSQLIEIVCVGGVALEAANVGRKRLCAIYW